MTSQSTLHCAVAVRNKAVLDLLRDARECAREAGTDQWQFALEIDSLRSAGLSNNELRMLAWCGILEHADECTRPSDAKRRFRRFKSLALTRHTCFVLTADGHRWLSRACDAEPLVERGGPAAKPLPPLLSSAPPSPSPPPGVPNWDSTIHELRLGKRLIKRFTHPAASQELILSVFQEEGWPLAIDDPLPVQFAQDPKRRLHYTIQNLNRAQRPHRIRFFINGNGQSIRWELVKSKRKRAGDARATRNRR